ncbi:hypothetical protein COCMIDRAFT_31930 [Bipolaris oryzae ATCC 44560]|uniref:G-protein coupled receptors family 1 profile domain-containing protein n=1 Tax=Bipolaris oryzae ATCC 44560 TaxID=930090 RepID=W6ZKZ2_COCMI|nr:uncharacterized protein COCMIDRAFT_31930 [Bipolaris oryzae ATCC 44560]EUC50725.1 hypothetical protein COCMIDRAFT_31930 [Bipolaris oryzae ATCC 44560]
MSTCVRLCCIVFLSLSFVVSAVPLNEHYGTQYTASIAANERRTRIITTVALVFSSLSMTASLVAFFWVCRMEKQFRHRLLMLLICGDLIRAFCFVVGAIVMLARGPVESTSAYCQSSGFFIAFGTEISDFAVLMIAIHTALQVFRPSGQAPSEGLHPYKYYVYAGVFCAPTVSASLAFLNTQGAYRLQGAYCLLPTRPFWYRLALAWIPRYFIVLIIISLAIAIYTYVGWEFKNYNAMSRKLGYTLNNDLTRASIDIRASRTNASLFGDGYVPSEEFATRPASIMTQQKQSGLHSRRTSTTSQKPVTVPERRYSASLTCNELCGAPGPTSILTASTSPTAPSFVRSTRRFRTHGKHSGPARPPLVSIPSGQTVGRVEHDDSLHPCVSSSHTDILSASTPTLHAFPAASSTPELALLEPPSPGFNRMIRQRARIHRQLRLTFIYPMVYTLMWVAPFVYHCLMYNDYYVRKPIWGIRLASSFCIVSMGFVNCLVFSLQEKPWRGIATSDGTLLGSFFVWDGRNDRWTRRLRGRSRSAGASGAPRGEVAQRSLSDSGLYRPRRSIGSSAGFYGYSRVEKNWARERLEWEREERFRVLREKAMKGDTSSTRTHSVCESSLCGDGEHDFVHDDNDGEEMTDWNTEKQRHEDVISPDVHDKGSDTNS